jgi:hypothetical protein
MWMTNQNYETSDNFGPEHHHLLEIDSVETFGDDTHTHMSHANNNCHLHFKTILNRQNISCI